MAEFIPPRNEVPELETTLKVISTISGERASSVFGDEPRIRQTGPVAVASPVAVAPAPARPVAIDDPKPHSHTPPPVKRQIVCFSFYKVLPEWRRLPAEEKPRIRPPSPTSSPDGTSPASSSRSRIPQ